MAHGIFQQIALTTNNQDSTGSQEIFQRRKRNIINVNESKNHTILKTFVHITPTR